MEIIMYDIIMKNRLHARVDFSNALNEYDITIIMMGCACTNPQKLL